MFAPEPIGWIGRPPAQIRWRRRRRRAMRIGAVGVVVILVVTLAHVSLPTLAAVSRSGGSTAGGNGPAPVAVPAGTPPRVASAQAATAVVHRQLSPVWLRPIDGQLPPATAVPLGPAARRVSAVKTTQKVVALTFDDGWSPPAGRLILNILVREHVAATFFVNAMYVRWDPTLWKNIAAAGFPIGNHTYDHANLTTLSTDAIVADIHRDAYVFRELTGYSMAPLLRPPYGARNRVVDAAIRAAGYPTEILWNVVAGDTDGPISDAAQIARASAGGPGSIVLLHVGPASTPRILAAVIANYRARGFSFVTIPQLLALPH